LRSLLGLTGLDHRRNTTVREKLKVEHMAGESQSDQKIGYNMLKGKNMHEYLGWHWNTNQKAKTT
jgi:hypothetical protein